VLSSELEHCLNDAFHHAREAHHEFLSLEHLLLALLAAAKVCEILGAIGADPQQLTQELRAHMEGIPRLDESPQREVLPTLGFQRVLQRAVFHVQSSGKKEVGVANVLVAIFSEKQSYAVELLNRHKVTRFDVANYILGGSEDTQNTGAGAGGVHTAPPVAKGGTSNVPLERPRALARLLGPALTAVAVTGWINAGSLIAPAGPEPVGSLYIQGVLVFVAGLVILSIHNRWSPHWSVLITLIGWLATLAGLARMLAPVNSRQILQHAPVLYGSLLTLFVIGVILTYEAYIKRAS